jgi:hypothetical protein
MIIVTVMVIDTLSARLRHRLLAMEHLREPVTPVARNASRPGGRAARPASGHADRWLASEDPLLALCAGGIGIYVMGW